ncbi:hypothetical protein GWI72_00825 [Microvirga tunisiensis]|uniref:Bacteriophage Mu GpT domain-containing protein n=1 Tax=Pannonibacter tanglangensis TaxID=2750084 RepID=A0A7X5EZ73_9HYPH|nr:Mu-like prophage major head subunit gpT family protein [Pannonibacter sp. XCT-53]NBN76806.1 hypothetical protein [Pannonibacter sp. XCT-53]
MPRVITPEIIEASFKGFKTAYQRGFASSTSLYTSLATVITSTAREEVYSWLGDMPKMREWIGDRRVKQLSAKGYSIRNRTFEMTVGVRREDIEDDSLGLYAPRFEMMGQSAASHPDEILFELINKAFVSACYDGQNFFDTDHPVGPEGAQVSVSNMQAGAGETWILADFSRPLKPWVFQRRRDYNFARKEDANTSDHVFMRDEYLYGVDARVAAGYGFWQMAFGSKAELTSANLRAAYTAMTNFTDDEGRKLNIKPTHLIVGSGNLFKARDLLLPAQIGATTNVDQNLVSIIEAPMLQ